MKFSAQKISLFMLIVFLVIVLNYILHTNEEIFLNLKAYGYMGTFLACLLLNATILLPSSSTMVVMSMATIYNPIMIALVGALGTAFGEFTGYFAGYYGSAVVENNAVFHKITGIYEKSPNLAIVLFATLPLPFFDILGILAGSIKMGKKKFFLLCFIGKAVKMLVYAYIGVYTYNQITGR
ncbi:VTT domain-containing protein [Roseburia inulinivorans]|jgi:membrane protein YqaA with SNARE-associated domain|uniref:VTT domain-containing protein n=1 Tax=Roseburia inulinivorans TaxID=360807 RepID=UPI00266CAB83|nr:VTT domain-containing protein [Roseburia inulinivorans]